MTSLKLAVVGAGHLGRIHAKLLGEIPHVELVGVADPVAAARDKVAADCHTTPYADHRRLIGKVDAAIIAVPTMYHHAVALDFLRQGTPLLIEKPLAANSTQANELVETAARHGAIVQVGHIERFNPAFVAARDQQVALLREAEQSLADENTRSERLKTQFDDNEIELADLTETLLVRIGNMGELFGVVRQVAGDTKGIIDSSLVSAQIEGRSALADELAQASGLPSMGDLTNLYVLLLEEMAESGKVVRFNTEIITADGRATTAEVVRVGVFNVISGSDFLQFEPQTSSLQVLARQPARRFTSLAAGLFSATSGVVPMALDPSRGNILGLLIQAPSLMERIQQGGWLAM